MEKLTNYEKLKMQIQETKRPFIVFDVETTGIMNGNDNRITQIALAAYNYNQTSNQYELQDSIFMLAKPDKEVLENIEKLQVPTYQNAFNLTIRNLLYNIKKESLTCDKKINEFEEKLKQKPTQRRQDAYDSYQQKLSDILNKYGLNSGEFQKDKENYFESQKNTIINNRTFQMEVKERTEDTIEDMMAAKPLSAVLKAQGIKKNEWIEKNQGLTNNELQIGIEEFLKNYMQENTVFISNGLYASFHYLKKENLRLPENKEFIDMAQIAVSLKNTTQGNNKWTVNIGQFAEQYRKKTGQTIKTFDALTKALCFGEMVSDITGINLSNRSITLLENAVKECATKTNEDYILSLAQASELHWLPTKKHDFDTNGYVFNSLESVNFGNDKVYVDLEMMFVINDNFEITLSGDKTPIKTWEELESKIKALNADISDELLTKIQDRFMTISHERDVKQAETMSQPTPEELFQQDLYQKLQDFDTQLAKIQEKENAIDKEIEIANQQGIEFLNKKLLALKSFILGVNERAKNSSCFTLGEEIDFCCNDTLLRPYDYFEPFSIDCRFGQENEPEIEMRCRGIENIINSWDDIQKGIINMGLDALHAELKIKESPIQNKINKLEKLHKKSKSDIERD